MYQPGHNCFRQDLIITSFKKESGKYFLIKHPDCSETFEFGEGEYLLCKLMNGKLSPSQIIFIFEEKFKMQLTKDDFGKFSSSISEFGLLGPFQKRQPENKPNLSSNDNITSDSEQLNSLAIEAEKVKFETTPETNQVIQSSPSRTQTQSKIKKKAKIEGTGLVLCDPSKFFKFCAYLLNSLAVLPWLIIPCVVLAILTIVHNHFALWDNLFFLWESMNPLLAIAISLFTLNFISEVAQGIVFSCYGGTCNILQIKLKVGFFPLFSVNLQGVKRLSRKSQFWIFATPLLTRIFVFSLSVLIWKMNYTNQNNLAIIVLFLAQSSVIGLVIDSSPFWDSNGYKCFSICFNLPRLFEKTLRVWDMMLQGRPFPKTLSFRERLSLQIYACVLILVWIVLFFGLGGITAILLEEHFQGTGVIIFLILLALILRWYLAMNGKPSDSQSKISTINTSYDSTSSNNKLLKLNKSKIIKLFKHNRWQIGTLIVIAIILCLPYDYRPGGTIKLLPPKQQDIQVNITGKIIQVFFNGADNTWIKKNQILGIIRPSKQLNSATTPIDSDVLILQEQIKNQQAIVETKQAQLEKLLSTPRPEDINIAQTELKTSQKELIATQQRLRIAQRELDVVKNSLKVFQSQLEVAVKSFETSKIKTEFLTDEALRYKELYNAGVVSLQNYEDKKKLAEVGRSDMAEKQQVIQVRYQDVAKEENNVQVAMQKIEEQRQNVQTRMSRVDEKQANLQLVLSGPNPNEIIAARNEIEAAKANLQVVKQQLATVQSQLKGKNILMPFDGYITTSFLQKKVNTYIEQGGVFAVAEDNREIQGQINIPETDVGLFDINQEVEVKLVAYPNLSLIGKIISIEPTTAINEETNQGRFVKVVVQLPNSGKLLKSGMSGYAKTEGVTMPIIAAFTRPIVRFIQVEIWSWIP